MQSENIARKIGSDVILGLNTSPKILLPKSKIYEIKKRIKYHLVLVKPNFGCSTKKVFSINKIASKQRYFNLKSQISNELIINGKNDLEISAFKIHPKLF